MPKRMNKSEFIDSSNVIHKNKYVYDKTIYKNNKTKVSISCPIHGDFIQIPYNHLLGFGCSECSNNLKITKEDFIRRSIEIHKNKYIYDRVLNIKNNSTKVDIICPNHGCFTQVVSSHLSGHGCSRCYGNNRLDTDAFIKKSISLHGDIYSYNHSNYINTNTKINIECLEHGVFSQTPHSHLMGRGCPVCKISKGELEIKKFLDKNNIIYKRQYYFDDLKNKSYLYFDFGIMDRFGNLTTLIEYNGIQHYEFTKVFHNDEYNFIDSVNRDRMKIEYCLSNNIKIYIITYEENINDRLYSIFKLNSM